MTLRRISAALSLLLASCSGGAASTTTTTTTTLAVTSTSVADTTTTTQVVTTTQPVDTTTTTEAFVPLGTFRVVVIVDLTSEDVSLEEAQALVDTASGIHQQLSGFSVEMIDYVRATPPTSVEGTDTIRDLDQMVYDYEAAHFPDMPDGFMIFSYGRTGSAALYGGYTYTVPANPAHSYRFVGAFHEEPIYHVGVVHHGHRYAQCGYGADTLVEMPLQTTSSGGECRGVDGVQCVDRNGYSMCLTAVDDLYASTIAFFASSTIVHETMHNFGVDVATDHYGTEACTAAMIAAGSTREYEPDNRALFQSYSGICPFLYDRFIDSYTGVP